MCAGLLSCESDHKGEILAPLFFDAAYDEATAGTYAEPNDSLATAIPIATNNQTHAATFHIVSDVDYYAFVAAVGATYRVRAEAMDAGIQTRIEVLNTAEYVLARDTNGAPAEGSSLLDWSTVIGGTYYIRVSCVGEQTGRYGIRISVNEDGYEPDNSTGTADTVNFSGIAQQRTLHDITDEDYIAFDADSGFDYHIEVSSDFYPPAGEPQPFALAVVNNSGNALVRNLPDYGSSLQITAPRRERLYVRITPRDVGAFGTYTLRVVVTGDRFEMDNSLDDAQSISLGLNSPQRRAVGGDDAEDYLKFEAREGYRYNILASDLSPGLRLHASIHSRSGAAIVETELGSGTHWRWNATLDPDSQDRAFFLRIRSATGLPGAYSIRIYEDWARIGPRIALIPFRTRDSPKRGHTRVRMRIACRRAGEQDSLGD